MSCKTTSYKYPVADPQTSVVTTNPLCEPASMNNLTDVQVIVLIVQIAWTTKFDRSLAISIRFDVSGFGLSDHRLLSLVVAQALIHFWQTVGHFRDPDWDTFYRDLWDLTWLCLPVLVRSRMLYRFSSMCSVQGSLIPAHKVPVTNEISHPSDLL
jgi:hypothetical protein